jgi:hypothetical protein
VSSRELPSGAALQSLCSPLPLLTCPSLLSSPLLPSATGQTERRNAFSFFCLRPRSLEGKGPGMRPGKGRTHAEQKRGGEIGARAVLAPVDWRSWQGPLCGSKLGLLPRTLWPSMLGRRRKAWNVLTHSAHSVIHTATYHATAEAGLCPFDHASVSQRELILHTAS